MGASEIASRLWIGRASVYRVLGERSGEERQEAAMSMISSRSPKNWQQDRPSSMFEGP